jgi:hypothetical protein
MPLLIWLIVDYKIITYKSPKQQNSSPEIFEGNEKSI